MKSKEIKIIDDYGLFKSKEKELTDYIIKKFENSRFYPKLIYIGTRDVDADVIFYFEFDDTDITVVAFGDECKIGDDKYMIFNDKWMKKIGEVYQNEFNSMRYACIKNEKYVIIDNRIGKLNNEKQT